MTHHGIWWFDAVSRPCKGQALVPRIRQYSVICKSYLNAMLPACTHHLDSIAAPIDWPDMTESSLTKPRWYVLGYEQKDWNAYLVRRSHMGIDHDKTNSEHCLAPQKAPTWGISVGKGTFGCPNTYIHSKACDWDMHGKAHDHLFCLVLLGNSLLDHGGPIWTPCWVFIVSCLK